jgi:UDP-N-acetylglucosamine--N-acetylmuramyl-(pentapeptide) pyrophosphoryl-undecaprenol N-acetylglucosamine transferase
MALIPEPPTPTTWMRRGCERSNEDWSVDDATMGKDVRATCETAVLMAGGPNVVIAAGGTGGHIYPGLALAEALLASEQGGKGADLRLSFTGTPHGLEGDLIPKAGHHLDLYDMVQFAGTGWRKGLVPIALARATAQARTILRRRRADVAISMGGYSGIPLIMAARLCGIPSLVHEPGAVPGKANRLAVRFTKHVATSFPGTPFPGKIVRNVGYPLSRAITTFDRDALRPDARTSFGLDDHTAMVLVNGGSQGAQSLNRLALGLAERWAERDDVRIVLKAGARNHEAVAAELATNPGRERVDLVRYLDRMDHAYAAADVTVCRAGAGTVSELALVELPAILVPFPHDEHDEQVHNAQPLVRTGGAILVRDHEATAEVVGPLLDERLADRSMLDSMRLGMKANAKPHAADDLAAWALELAEATP